MKKEVEELISIRPFIPSDLSFIKNTMVPGLYNGNKYSKATPFTRGAPADFNELIDEAVFATAYEYIIDRIIERPETSVIVAADKIDPETVYGYSIYKREVLYYVYVKVAWRNNGIAKRLIPEDVKHAAFLTKSGIALMNKLNIKYNPFI